MKIEKKHIITGLIGLVTITGAVAYWQYQKAMDYTFKVGISKVKSFTDKLISIDLLIDFINKSSLGLHVISNKSNIYINNILASKVENNTPFDILADSSSKIPVNVSFDPGVIFKKLGIKITDVLLAPEKIVVRIDTALKVKFWGIGINLKDSTSYTVKEMLQMMVSSKKS